MAIPVSVVIVTKNEAQKIALCLSSLQQFDDVWVVDSNSRDGTKEIAEANGAKTVSYHWNGQYPKKRQWCLDHLDFCYPWILFVDADEMVTVELCDEIQSVLLSSPQEAGFFITGRYCLGGKILRFGMPNQKIVFIHKDRMKFPVVDDLDIPGMGEIEGHYQPVLKEGAPHLRIGKLNSIMIHSAMDDVRAWDFRHEKYARWEVGMNAKAAWPVDPVPWRQWVKVWLRQSRFRPELMFLACFVVKLGFLDGRKGLDFARKKGFYYKVIKNIAKKNHL